jgi:hypothetical protein
MQPWLTDLLIVNRALVEIAQGVPLAGGNAGTNFDGSPNGIYAATLYAGAVQMLLRQQDYEFAREVVSLVSSGRAPALGWAYSYIYPLNAIRIRQILPASFDPNDPQPITWNVAFDGTAEVIYTNATSAQAVITTADLTESPGRWDDMFVEQMVRYLGSQLAIPVAGRPDFSEKMLDWSGKIGGAAMDRDS